MGKLWILRGDVEAPGWDVLRADQKEEKVDIIHLDPHRWAILDADEAPTGYEGIDVFEPEDGIYLDPNGSPLYLVRGTIVSGPEEVIDALGDRARELLEKIGDADVVLERMGRAF